MDAATPPLNREALRRSLTAEIDRVLDEVADAVDHAPAGRVIRDSEEKVRDVLDRFREQVYQEALQQKIDAAEAAFPPSGDRPGTPQAK